MAAGNTQRSFLLLFLVLQGAATLASAAVHEDSFSSEYQPPRKDENYLVYALSALGITGFSLLFPDMLTVNTRRRRSDAGTETVVKEGLTEHLVGVYQTALESEECMQRLACKLGAATSSLRQRHKGLVHRLVSSMTTSKFSDLYNKFSSGVDAETCATYSCSKMKKL